MRKVSVSFMGAQKPEKFIEKIAASSADFIHVDVADGKFVTEKHQPFKMLEKISHLYRKRLDVHLMVKNPKAYIDKYARLNTEYLTVHIELKEDLLEIIKYIKSYGIKAGLSIKADSDLELLTPYLNDISLILIMTVEPGKSGGEHIDMSERLNVLKEMTKDKNLEIAVDGGINADNVSSYEKADIIVSASYLISGDDLEERINSLR